MIRINLEPLLVILTYINNGKPVYISPYADKEQRCIWITEGNPDEGKKFETENCCFNYKTKVASGLSLTWYHKLNEFQDRFGETYNSFLVDMADWVKRNPEFTWWNEKVKVQGA